MRIEDKFWSPRLQKLPSDSACFAPAGVAAIGLCRTYANPYIGEAVVVEKAGRLEIRLGPDGKKAFPLSHFDRDLFTYHPSPEMPTMPVAITFEIGPDQKAIGIKIDDLNELGLGVLERTGG